MEQTARFRTAVAAIDEVNAADPQVVVRDGVARPKELVHAELMTHRVQELDPSATDAQLLAARAHHLRRWAVPRRSYPDGRAGYLRWRRDQKDRHAREVTELLQQVGYDDATIARVSSIIRKEGLGRDPEVQVHEDALCLVFLELQLDEVAEQLGEEKALDVLERTLRKMSADARTRALGLPLSPAAHRLLRVAADSAG